MHTYRWCDDFGGGLVLATSEEDARKKLVAKYGMSCGDFTIWLWENDEFYDKNHPDVYDIY